MLSTDFRLRKHADYQRVYKAGRKQYARQIAFFFALRPADDSAGRTASNSSPAHSGPRIGLTVPKAIGNAVVRNRIKRRLREAVREALPLLSAPVDVVLHPRLTVLEAEFVSVRSEVESIFRTVSGRLAAPAPDRGLPSAPLAGAGRRKPSEPGP